MMVMTDDENEAENNGVQNFCLFCLDVVCTNDWIGKFDFMQVHLIA